ncbi:RmlC-like cupin [Dichomitus squalens LYAD-421 SS1]|uniref:RmlC-like cupin n=1 Tax=Dichomitus squalens (strain LYAD-421) TaxID=732165 RepID=UPI00044153C4|nr:RmlC-like cupin [Dichomitus squalens LYAD-421 SS1]EJF62626.1 RmlC-like cupin [Dichomitus squalens LYAD-421 SS1]
MKVTPRPNTERGQRDLGWLKAFHTFSAPGFDRPDHERWGPLRVINEDRIAEGTGFGLHRHQDFEIFSYIVGGELEHRDTMNHNEVLKRGDIQMTSAGSGIQHSEHAHGAHSAHLLQIWAFPTATGLAPKYFTRTFSDAEKADKWVCVVAPAGVEGVVEEFSAKGPAPIHSPLTLFATMISEGQHVTHAFLKGTEGKERKGYLQLSQRSAYNTGAASGAHVRVLGAERGPIELREGDGAYVVATPGEDITVENIGQGVAEVLLFDME